MTTPNDQPTPQITGVNLENVTVARDLAIGAIHIGDNYITQPAERPPLWVRVPGLPAHFLGRDALLDDLVERLLRDGAPAVAIHGLPGVGKSTIAVMLAHHKRLLAHFSDGVLWAGLGVNADLPSLLNRWATALEVDLTDLRSDAQRAQAIRDAIGHKRLLLVIDDAWQSEPAHILRCGGDNCAYLLTTRDRGVARAFAGAEQTVDVAVLEASPAHLLLHTLAPEAWAANPATAAGLADAVGGLPLALELLGGYLAAPENSAFVELIDESLEEMTDPRRRLQLASRRLGDLSGAIVTLQATITLSLEGLPPAVLSAFYALGAFAPKPAYFDRKAAENVTEANLRTLALLAARNLLEIAPNEALALHQTIADVARAHTPADAIALHQEHYLDRVNADQDDWQAIESVYPQIQRAWLQTLPYDPATVDFADILSTYQSRRGLLSDRLKWLIVAVYTAGSNSDIKSQARMVNGLGILWHSVGEMEKALGYFEQALLLDIQVGDGHEMAATLTNIGLVYGALGEKQQALAYYAQSLPVFHQVGDKSGEAATLNNIGGVYDALGEKQQALDYYAQALPLSRQVGDKSGEARTLTSIGAVYSDLGEEQQALAYCAQALPLFRQVGDKSGEATTLNNIGAVYSDLGEKQQALDYYERALPLIRQVGDKSGWAATINNIGQVYSDLGEKQQALDYYAQALPLFRQVGNKSGEATTLTNIGAAYFALGEKQQALAYYAQALPLRRQVGDKSGEATTLTNIGAVYLDLGEKQQALAYFAQALPLQRQVGDRSGEATTLNNMAAIYFQQNDFMQAAQLVESVIRVFSEVGAAPYEAGARFNLAFVLATKLGRIPEAITHVEQSIALLTRYRLPQDAAGQTLAQHQAFLAQLRAAQ